MNQLARSTMKGPVKDSETLYRCRARLHMSTERLPSSAVTMYLIVLTLVLLFIANYLFWFVLGRASSPCVGVLLVPAVLCGAIATLRLVRPKHQGLLTLGPDALVFRHTLSGRHERLPLADLHRVGRKRRVLHVARQGARTTHYFACSPLRAEDLYDRLIARLDELGLDVTNHERQR